MLNQVFDQFYSVGSGGDLCAGNSFHQPSKEKKMFKKIYFFYLFALEQVAVFFCFHCRCSSPDNLPLILSRTLIISLVWKGVELGHVVCSSF